MTTPTFVYDGDCSFCTSCAEFIERRIPTRARVVPWQFADLDALGLTAEQCEQAVQWVGADGGTAAGPDAIALLLRDAGRFWRPAGDALRLGPVRLAAWPAYRWVAEHRHLLPGGTAACSRQPRSPGSPRRPEDQTPVAAQARRDLRYGPGESGSEATG